VTQEIETPKAPRVSELINELVSRVTH